MSPALRRGEQLLATLSEDGRRELRAVAAESKTKIELQQRLQQLPIGKKLGHRLALSAVLLAGGPELAPASAAPVAPLSPLSPRFVALV